MKMELIKTTSFDEFMTEYYELNNTSNTDTNESVTKSEYEVDKESGIITRREFLKYSALGTATVIMGASTERAEAVVPFLVLGAIALASSAWASDEFIDWRITIGNDSYRDTLRESGGFVLVSESDFDEFIMLPIFHTSKEDNLISPHYDTFGNFLSPLALELLIA